MGWFLGLSAAALGSTGMQQGEECRKTGAEIVLLFSTGPQLKAAEAERASAELREPKPTSEGIVLASLRYPGIEGVLLDRYLLVVRDSAGNELARVEPERSYRLPEAPGAGQQWWNAFGHDFTTAPPLPMEVFVVDQSTNIRCKWVIGADTVPRLDRGDTPAPTELPNVGAWCKTDGDCIGPDTVCRKSTCVIE